MSAASPTRWALLPGKALRLDGRTIGGLRKLGLDLVGQLATAPRGPLARRFGAGLLLRLDQALGRVSEPIEPVLPSEIVAVRRSFVEPLSTPEAFATVIAVLVEEACAQLERRGEGARRLDLRYERVDATVQVISAGTARPVRDARHLARLLGERIEQVDPGLGVEAMLLVLPLVEALGYRQQGSGLGTDQPGEAALAELVDRLSNRLGADRVYRLISLESDVPERSQSRVPVFGPAGATPWTSSWPRPVRLLRRPGAGGGAGDDAGPSAESLHLAAGAAPRDARRRSRAHHRRVVAPAGRGRRRARLLGGGEHRGAALLAVSPGRRARPGDGRSRLVPARLLLSGDAS